MKRMHRRKISLAVMQALSAGVIVGLSAPQAYAQTTAAAAPIEKLEVTGSRIPSPNLESTSPISTISAKDIAFQNPVSTENLLNQMPQVFAEFGNAINNAASGTATVNLRGLGSSRTLVLINGRRLPAGDPQLFPPDINQVPVGLISRVEILTGGASAVYGSDAVAGVVNFIMNDHFEGVQGEIGHSFYNHHQNNDLAAAVAHSAITNPGNYHVPGDVDSDGEVDSYSLILGSNFADNKGNATVYFSYQRSQAVLAGNRDFGACAAGASKTRGRTCGSASATSASGYFAGGSTNSAGYAAGQTVADAAGNMRPFVGATDGFNFAPYNYYQRPDQRYNVNAFAHYDVTSWARVYTEFGFMDDRTTEQLAPSGDFGTNLVTLSANNPLLSANFLNTFGITPGNPQTLLILRRNVEGGPRVQDFEHESFRSVLGVKGEVWGGWDYDLWYQYGRVNVTSHLNQQLSDRRIQNATDVVLVNGVPTCTSVVNGTDPACVPWNIFARGGVTPAAVNYVTVPAIQTGFTDQSVYGATLTGDLGMYGVKTPWASDGVGVAGGIEHRTEKLSLSPDLELTSGDISGQGPVLPLNGQYSVNEIYGEVNVPILEDRPWAKLLSVNASARYSDYTTNKHTDTYGIGVEWAPVREVRLRGSYQKAIRAANVVELFTAQGLNLFTFANDPCGGPAPSATLQQCLRTGLPANLYGSQLLNNPAGQGNYLQGGNPELDPERAKTWTGGAVYTPGKNLSLSVDYFKIKVDGVIGRLDPNTILTQCLDTGALCAQVHRDTSFGTLWAGNGIIDSVNVNLGQLKTSGVDFNGNYTVPIGAWGSVGTALIATYLIDLTTTPIPGGGNYNCAGFFGPTCGVSSPKWRFHLTGTWNTPWNVDLNATIRYFEHVALDRTSSNPLLQTGSFNSIDAGMGSRTYVDFAGAWYITKNWTLRAGINNAFDKDPPIVSNSLLGPPFGSQNTYPQVYDTMGRQIYVNLTAKF